MTNGQLFSKCPFSVIILTTKMPSISVISSKKRLKQKNVKAAKALYDLAKLVRCILWCEQAGRYVYSPAV